MSKCSQEQNTQSFDGLSLKIRLEEIQINGYEFNGVIQISMGDLTFTETIVIHMKGANSYTFSLVLEGDMYDEYADPVIHSFAINGHELDPLLYEEESIAAPILKKRLNVALKGELLKAAKKQ